MRDEHMDKQLFGQEQFNAGRVSGYAEAKQELEENLIEATKLMNRIFKGLEQGISTVPNSYPHEELRILLKKMNAK